MTIYWFLPHIFSRLRCKNRTMKTVGQRPPDPQNSYCISSDRSERTESTAAMSFDGLSREEAVKMFNASKGDRANFDFDYEDNQAPSYDDLDWIPETSSTKKNPPKENKETGTSQKKKPKKKLRVKASDLGIVSDHAGLVKIKSGDITMGPNGKHLKIRRKLSVTGTNETAHTGAEEMDMKAISDAVKLWRSENVPASKARSSRSKSRGPDQNRRRRSVSRGRKDDGGTPKTSSSRSPSKGRVSSIAVKPQKSDQGPESPPKGRRGRSTTRKKIVPTEVVSTVSNDNETTFKLKRRSRSEKRRSEESPTTPAKPRRRPVRSKSFRTARSPGLAQSVDDENPVPVTTDSIVRPRGLSRSRSLRSRSLSKRSTRTPVILRRSKSNDYDLWASSSDLATSMSSFDGDMQFSKAFENRMNRRCESLDT